MVLLYNLQRLHLGGLKIYERRKGMLNEQIKYFDKASELLQYSKGYLNSC